MLSPEDILNQGAEYCLKGNLAKGIEMYRQALTLNPRPSTKIVLNHNLSTALCQQAGVVWGPGGRLPVNEHNISLLDEAVKCWDEVCRIYQLEVEGTDEEYEFAGTPPLREYMKMASNNGLAIGIKLDQVRGIGPFKKEKKSSSGCFIATVVYESQISHEIQVLKAFRDKYLSKSFLGEWLIENYYKVSPFVAEILKQNYILKKVAKIVVVNPVVTIIKIIEK